MYVCNKKAPKDMFKTKIITLIFSIQNDPILTNASISIYQPLFCFVVFLGGRGGEGAAAHNFFCRFQNGLVKYMEKVASENLIKYMD